MCTIELYLTQGGVGSFLATWPGSVVWPGGVTPTLSTAAASVDRFVLETHDGGTTWYGVQVGVASSSTGTSAQRILLADGHATPFVFTDLLQMDDGSDFMWSDP